MIEFHDQHGDEHDHVPEPDPDLPGDRRADAVGERAIAPLGDLPGHADVAPELHFPGDDAAAKPPGADLDPAAPWPDDSEFKQWLAANDDDVAGDAPAAEALLAAPEDGDTLASSDELVEWTLRRLGEESS